MHVQPPATNPVFGQDHADSTPRASFEHSPELAAPVNEDEPIAKPTESSEWLPAVDDTTPTAQGHTRAGSILKNGHTPSSAASSLRGRVKGQNGVERSGSIGAASTGKRSMFSNRDGDPVSGSAFINGAGTTGPDATPDIDQSIHTRTASAEASLSPKQKSKIVKAERKSSKRLTKIIKEEAKVEKRSLDLSIAELAALQNVQKSAIKREAKCQSAHGKALTSFQKIESAFLDLRTKYEAAQAVLNAEADALENARSNARETTEKMQEKSQEVESLRTMLGVDQREREVKLAQLTGKKSSSRGLWK